MHAEVDLRLPLPGLSPVCGKPIVARFDGGQLSSDGGILLLAQVERRLGIAERLARCIEDPRAPDQIRHEVAEMIRFRALAIAAGYPDANDCDVLRKDVDLRLWACACSRAGTVRATGLRRRDRDRGCSTRWRWATTCGGLAGI